MGRPWERQPGESGAANLALRRYLRKPPENRGSFAALAEECGVAPSTVYRWRQEWNWDARILAYDAEYVATEDEVARLVVERSRERLRAAVEPALEALVDMALGRKLDPLSGYYIERRDLKPNVQLAAIRQLLDRAGVVKPPESVEHRVSGSVTMEAGPDPAQLARVLAALPDSVVESLSALPTEPAMEAELVEAEPNPFAKLEPENDEST